MTPDEARTFAHYVAQAIAEELEQLPDEFAERNPTRLDVCVHIADKASAVWPRSSFERRAAELADADADAVMLRIEGARELFKSGIPRAMADGALAGWAGAVAHKYAERFKRGKKSR